MTSLGLRPPSSPLVCSRGRSDGADRRVSRCSPRRRVRQLYHAPRAGSGAAHRAGGPQADDGPARHQGAPPRGRRQPEVAERRQLRRVEGQPVPDLPDPLVFKNGKKVTTADDVVEEAAAGDRRGLRPRGLRPRAEGDAEGEVGGGRDREGEGRRRPGRHQAARRPRRQLRRTRRSRSTSSSR